MKKLRYVILKKELIFLLAVMLIIVLATSIDGQKKITAECGDSAIQILSKRYTAEIPYEQIDTLEMVELSEYGVLLDGFEDITIRSGTWENDQWGTYRLCAVPYVSCVVLHLTDGQILAFNLPSEEATWEVYETVVTRTGK